jgi:hypothetical protein
MSATNRPQNISRGLARASTRAGCLTTEKLPAAAYGSARPQDLGRRGTPNHGPWSDAAQSVRRLGYEACTTGDARRAG